MLLSSPVSEKPSLTCNLLPKQMLSSSWWNCTCVAGVCTAVSPLHAFICMFESVFTCAAVASSLPGHCLPVIPPYGVRDFHLVWSRIWIPAYFLSLWPRLHHVLCHSCNDKPTQSQRELNPFKFLYDIFLKSYFKTSLQEFSVCTAGLFFTELVKSGCPVHPQWHVVLYWNISGINLIGLVRGMHMMIYIHQGKLLFRHPSRQIALM